MAAADLFDHAAYVRTTGDLVTDPHEVEMHWLDALALVQEKLQRFLAQDTYTHRLRVWPRGFVYPHAVPVASVSVTAGYYVEDDYTLAGVSADSLPLVINPSSLPLYADFGRWLTYQHDGVWATVTYVGGYTSATFPVTLRKCVDAVAGALVTGPSASMLQRGVQSATVGDVSLTAADGMGGGDELDELVPGITKTLRRFRLPNYA
jgi:hypothetical protein